MFPKQYIYMYKGIKNEKTKTKNQEQKMSISQKNAVKILTAQNKQFIFQTTE